MRIARHGTVPNDTVRATGVDRFLENAGKIPGDLAEDLNVIRRHAERLRASLAAGQAMPFAKADLTIDAVPTTLEIDPVFRITPARCRCMMGTTCRAAKYRLLTLTFMTKSHSSGVKLALFAIVPSSTGPLL